jgi:hypothetical protein
MRALMNKVCKQVERATGAMSAFDGSKLLFMSAPIPDAPVRWSFGAHAHCAESESESELKCTLQGVYLRSVAPANCTLLRIFLCACLVPMPHLSASLVIALVCSFPFSHLPALYPFFFLSPASHTSPHLS